MAEFTIMSWERGHPNVTTVTTVFAVVRDGNLLIPETDWREDAAEVAQLLLKIREQHVLREAFLQVTTGMANWKDPISTEITPGMRPIAMLAIPFMTGAVPTFEVLPNGNYLVKAAGYYAAVGA